MSVPTSIYGPEPERAAASAEVTTLVSISAETPSPGAPSAPSDASSGLTNLFTAYVPALCDGLRVELRAGATSVIATYPPTSTTAELPANSRGDVVIPTSSVPVAGEPEVVGTVTCTWRDSSRPTGTDVVVAHLLAEHALATMRLETLAAVLLAQQERAANLEQALATNREIGQALGILMATEHLTAAQAFDRLRTVSQRSHRKLREIAAAVVQTGMLPVSAEAAESAELHRPEVALGPPQRERPDRAERRGETPVPHLVRRTRGGQPCVPAPAASAVPAD